MCGNLSGDPLALSICCFYTDFMIAMAKSLTCRFPSYFDVSRVSDKKTFSQALRAETLWRTFMAFETRFTDFKAEWRTFEGRSETAERIKTKRETGCVRQLAKEAMKSCVPACFDV